MRSRCRARASTTPRRTHERTWLRAMPPTQAPAEPRDGSNRWRSRTTTANVSAARSAAISGHRATRARERTTAGYCPMKNSPSTVGSERASTSICVNRSSRPPGAEAPPGEGSARRRRIPLRCSKPAGCRDRWLADPTRSLRTARRSGPPVASPLRGQPEPASWSPPGRSVGVAHGRSRRLVLVRSGQVAGRDGGDPRRRGAARWRARPIRLVRATDGGRHRARRVASRCAATRPRPALRVDRHARAPPRRAHLGAVPAGARRRAVARGHGSDKMPSGAPRARRTRCRRRRDRRGARWEPRVLDVGARLTGPLGRRPTSAPRPLLLPICVRGVAVDRRRRRRCDRDARRRRGADAPVRDPGLRRAGRVGRVHRARGGCSSSPAVVRITGPATHRGRGHGRAGRSRSSGSRLLTPVGPRVASTFDATSPAAAAGSTNGASRRACCVDSRCSASVPRGTASRSPRASTTPTNVTHGRDPLPDRAHAAPLDIAAHRWPPALVAWLAFLALGVAADVSGARCARPAVAGRARRRRRRLSARAAAPLPHRRDRTAGVAARRRGDRRDCPPEERRERVLPPLVSPALALLAAARARRGWTRRRGRPIGTRQQSTRWRAATPTPRRTRPSTRALRPDEVRLHLLESRALVADGRGTLRRDRRDRPRARPVTRRTRSRAESARRCCSIARGRRWCPSTSRPRDDGSQRSSIVIRTGPRCWLLAGHAARLGGDAAHAEEAWQRAEDLAPRSAAPRGRARAALPRAGSTGGRPRRGRARARRGSRRRHGSRGAAPPGGGGLMERWNRCGRSSVCTACSNPTDGS